MSRHPELWPALAVLAAWVTVLVLDRRDGGSSAGMTMGARQPAGWARAVWVQAMAGLPSWLLMTVAMMGPAALARLRYTGRAATRPLRAMTAFAACYLAIWAAFGLLAQAVVAVIPGVPGTRALALALIASVAWQLSPAKRRLLRACHRASHRTPGPAVTATAALSTGLRYGLCCLGACWCLMLVMVAAPAGQLLWLAGLSAVVTAERVGRDSRAVTRDVAAALGVAAVATLAVGGLLG